MFSSRRQRQRAILAALAVTGILLGALLFNGRLLDSSLQAATYDTFITYAPGKLSNQVTIIALDDKLVTRYGTYPVPRQAWVDLLASLKPMGARSIAFDIGFYDESPNTDQDRAARRRRSGASSRRPSPARSWTSKRAASSRSAARRSGSPSCSATSADSPR